MPAPTAALAAPKFARSSTPIALPSRHSRLAVRPSRQLKRNLTMYALSELLSEGEPLAPARAERIAVGKKGYGKACKQGEINELMVALAAAGRRVVRLKAGDPLMFGRLEEEMAALDAAGIRFEVVPGISAAQGAAARL